MTLYDLFWGIGDFLYWTFQLLQNDFWLTSFVNYGAILLGFGGLLYWLNLQKKFNAQAESDPNQLK